MEHWLFVGDILFNVLVVSPLSLLWWSGTWKLLDLYIVPSDLFISSWISLLIGSFLSILGYFVAALLEETIQSQCSLKHVTVSRLFIYLNSFGLLNYWRGVWTLSDLFIGKSVLPSCITFAISHIALVFLKSSSNSFGQPFIVGVDHRPDFYKTTPRFRTQADNLCNFTADVLFTHLIIHTLNIQVWRGLWNMFDNWIYPEDKRLSYIICFCTGIVSSLLLLSLQHPFRKLAEKAAQSHFILSAVVKDFVILCAVVSGLLLWRGGWGFMKDFVIIGDSELKDGWLFHGAGMAGLLIFSVGSSLTSLGCQVDGEQDPFAWPINYFTRIHEMYRQQQQHTIQAINDCGNERDPLLDNCSA